MGSAFFIARPRLEGHDGGNCEDAEAKEDPDQRVKNFDICNDAVSQVRERVLISSLLITHHRLEFLRKVLFNDRATIDFNGALDAGVEQIVHLMLAIISKLFIAHPRHEA